MLHKFQIISLVFFSVAIQLFAQNQQYADSLEIELSLEQDNHKKMQVLIELAKIYGNTELEKSINYANLAVKLAEEQNLHEIIVLAYLQKARVYWRMSDYKSSMEYASLAKDLAEELEMNSEYASAILIIGRIYSDLGDYKKSIDFDFQSLKVFEENNDSIGLAQALNSIGLNHYNQNNFDKASEYYYQSLNISRKINYQAGIARGLNNVAAVHGDSTDFEKLNLYIREAIEINIKIRRNLSVGINYMHLGAVFRQQSVFDSSLRYYNKALLIFEEMNMVPKIATCHLELTNYYVETGNPDIGFNHAYISYKLGLENNLNHTIYESARILHDLYLNINNQDSAYKYLTIQFRMKDSLDLESSMTKLSQLEMRYEFEKFEQEKKIEHQRREYTFIFVGTTMIFLLIIVIITLVFRHRIRVNKTFIKKKELESDLELKNKELTTNVMYSIQKNEVLTSITEELVNIRKSAAKEETRDAIHRISRKIKESVKDSAWEEFEIRFQQVHNDFYETISSSFPDLTPNEKRLCAFLRMDMSSKEISKITGQSIPALEMARVRLRKKLGIANTDTNLVNFLSQF